MLIVLEAPSSGTRPSALNAVFPALFYGAILGLIALGFYLKEKPQLYGKDCQTLAYLGVTLLTLLLLFSVTIFADMMNRGRSAVLAFGLLLPGWVICECQIGLGGLACLVAVLFLIWVIYLLSRALVRSAVDQESTLKRRLFLCGMVILATGLSTVGASLLGLVGASKMGPASVCFVSYAIVLIMPFFFTVWPSKTGLIRQET